MHQGFGVMHSQSAARNRFYAGRLRRFWPSDNKSGGWNSAALDLAIASAQREARQPPVATSPREPANAQFFK
jgi:hypothetical protein